MDLLRASRHGNQSAVDSLLRSGVDINAMSDEGRTPLSQAAEAGHEAVVKLLLAMRNHIQPDFKDNNGRTPLSWAAWKGDEAVVKLLLENDAVNPDSMDNNNRTPLSWAAGEGHTAVVKLLLGTNGIDPETKDNAGTTPLMWAALKGHEAVVRLFLANDAIKPDARDHANRTPLLWAILSGHEAVVTLLLANDAVNPGSIDTDNRTTLSWAAEKGLEAVVNDLLAHNNIDPDFKDNSGWTPLAWAAGEGHAAVVKLLLGNDNIDPDSRDNNGRTPLSWAAEKGHETVVKLLLANRNINPDAKDNSGRTPLFWAAGGWEHEGCEAVVKLLLAKDAVNPDPKDNEGWTPLSWAAERRCPRAWALLAKHNAYLNSKQFPGRSLLSRAAENGQEAVVKMLLGDDIDPDSKDNEGRTPLSWAAEKGHDTVVKLLLAKDTVDPDSKDNDGRTPLTLAVEQGHTAVTSRLVGRDSVTLHMMVQEGKQTMVETLLSAGYKVNARDPLNRTPLHIAALFGRLEIAKSLISYKADINSEDRDGMTPLRSAIRRKDHNLVELLLRNSAEMKGIMSNNWLDAYEKINPNITIKLSKELGRKNYIHFIEGIQGDISAEPGIEKRLFLFPDYSAWSRCLISNLGVPLQLRTSQIFYQGQIHGSYVSVAVVAWLPDGTDLGSLRGFDISGWNRCGIAWTMTPPSSPKEGSGWKSIDHFSMLPYGWIPDDGVDFFTQFIVNLKERWLTMCHLAEEHLAARRLYQLHKKGESSELIHDLVEDAQKWAIIRSRLRGQVRTARKFSGEYCRRYNEDKCLTAEKAIDDFSDDVNDRIDRLEQTVKDLLQFEFAWVSINEAHRSTSIATSMKRLSWITFIFLPAMFASSLFGMNVDLLKDNPDWRWYLLFGGTTLLLTVVVWLIFKCSPIELWVERNAKNIRGRLRWESTA